MEAPPSNHGKGKRDNFTSIGLIYSYSTGGE